MSSAGSLEGEGIVVSATLDFVKKGAERVLTDFSTTIERQDGTVVEGDVTIEEGDQIVFRENMDQCPAVIAATKLGEDLWYVVSTTICPPIKCDDIQAMKCARLESQNLKIFQNVIKDNGEWKWVHEWRIDTAQLASAQKIIDNATKKWTH
ncbi:MAG: hypothetical protein ACXABV_13755 [Candidatus Thorarchaeota archaeon]|jgi:hypothetical protein